MEKQKTTHNKFTKSEAIRFGWEITKKNFWFVVAIVVISQGIGYLFSTFAQNLFDNKNLIAGLIIQILGTVINIEITFATTAIFFKLADKKKAKISDLFAYFDIKLMFRFFLMLFIFTLIFVLGLIFFIIPGIYLGLKYWFAPYIFVDKRKGILDAFRESAKLTQGIKWQLFLLLLIQLLLMIAGALTLLIGLFIAIPINYLSDIYIYRKLTSKS